MKRGGVSVGARWGGLVVNIEQCTSLPHLPLIKQRISSLLPRQVGWGSAEQLSLPHLAEGEEGDVAAASHNPSRGKKR
ncbi:hypothetical protein E2C01_072625 [Portunus trituberculatus]|uniref:Uncharacterized protein n=1 Tax=Portunus trituberculatus TaxID=210409 RepID=A0A5B7IBV0_PORTR|nr:hypothetical protein [Portunus trituberculatus]